MLGPGQLTDLTKASLFYAIAFSLCLGLAVAAPVLGDRTNILAMLTPAAAVLLLLLVVTRDGYTKDGWKGLGLHRVGLQSWGLALALPVVVLGFAYTGVWLSGVATFAAPQQWGSAGSVAFDVIASIVFVAVTVGIGEEVGWRGYLLPHLMGLGATRALLLSGLLHGLWHLPILLGTPFYHGSGDRLIVVPLFLATLTVAGVCYGYLRLTTGSVWPAAIAHATFNIVWDRLSDCTATSSPLALEYLAGESGVLTLAALTVAAVWFLRRLSGFK